MIEISKTNSAIRGAQISKAREEAAAGYLAFLRELKAAYDQLVANRELDGNPVSACPPFRSPLWRGSTQSNPYGDDDRKLNPNWPGVLRRAFAIF